MLIAHLADLHLGYRAYHRLAPGGVNQRERDVAEAAGRAIDQIVAAEPDLVVVAGDVFHTVRPPNSAIMDGFRLFTRLRAGLPDVPVVAIAGNHDSPRSADTGSILRLLAEIPRVYIIDDGARAVRLDDPDVSVLGLPHSALVGDEPPPTTPDPAAAVNVLMIHGTLSGAGVDENLLRMVEYGGAHLDRSALPEDDWDYIALGHYHNATRIESNLWYAGSTERTAPNIWAEADTRKGWVLYDTDTRTGEFQEIQTREVVDLPRFSARAGDDDWLTAEEIDDRVRDAVADMNGVSGKIVRLVITDVPRDLFRELDHGQIRELKAEALHFHLDARRPDVRRSAIPEEDRRRTLEEELTEFLKAWKPSTPGVNRERLLELGTEYLAGTEDWRDDALELPLDSTSDGYSESVPGGERGDEEGEGEDPAASPTTKDASP